MPYRTTRRKRPTYVAKKKRVYRRKRIMRKRQNNPSKMTFKPKKSLGIAFPERYLTKVKGTLLLSGAAALGAIDYQIRGNSILDFGESKSADNVSGFATLASIYRRCLVYGSKFKVEFANSTTTPKYLVLFPSDGVGSLPSSTVAYMDQPYAKSKLVSANTGIGKTTIAQYLSTKRMLGLKDLKDVEELFVDIETPAQPTRQWHWVFRIDNGTGAGTDSDVVKITMVYYIECFDRKVQNQA